MNSAASRPALTPKSGRAMAWTSATVAPPSTAAVALAARKNGTKFTLKLAANSALSRTQPASMERA